MDFKLSSKCSYCKKKTHIVMACCNCGYDMCISHRIPESHKCCGKLKTPQDLDLVKVIPRKVDKI